MYAVILSDIPELKINNHEVPNVEWISNANIIYELSNKTNRFVDGFEKFYLQVWKKLLK